MKKMKPLRLTKSMLASLDPSDVSMGLFKDHPEVGLTLSIAVQTVQRYLAEAAVQQRRIVRQQRALLLRFNAPTEPPVGKTKRLWPSMRRRRQRNDFRCVHLYLTCWVMIDRHLDLIARASKSQEIKDALRPYRATLKAYRDMRDHYEHFDERLPGQRNQRKLAIPADLGNFFGYTLSFGGKRVDIGPKSLVELKRIVSTTLFAFNAFAFVKLSSEDPRLLRRWFQPIQLDRLERHLRRELGSRAFD